MTIKEIDEYLKSFENVFVSHPFDEKTSVYKIGEETELDSKMFALIVDDSKPVRLSLKCDPGLAEKLREEYETILPGQNLNRKTWNTILCTGQVADDDLKSLILLSYNLAKDEN